MALCMLGGIEGSVGGVEGSLALERLGEFEGWVEFDKLAGRSMSVSVVMSEELDWLVTLGLSRELEGSVSVSMLGGIGVWVSFNMLLEGWELLVMRVLVLIDLLRNLSLAKTS